MIAILIGAALASAAPDTAAHAQWRACTNKTANNYEIDQCSGAYMKTADAQLNATWRRLMAAVASKPQTRAALLTEQRAWLGYSKTACAFYGVQADWGRAGEVSDGPECSAGVLERRTAELGAYLAYVGPTGEGSR